MKLFLIRHGQTGYNRDGLGLGRADVPLTDLGEKQSLALAERLADTPLSHIYTSPLLRARTMAEGIAGLQNLTVEPRDELLELDVGHTEGLTFAAMRERHAEFMTRWTEPGFESLPMPGGESLQDLNKRLIPFVEELLAMDAPAVAVVAHNFVIKVMLCQLLDIELSAFRSFTIDVASMCTFVLRHGRVTVAGLNDTCHLDSLNMER